jgi:hypothetical protein
MLAIIITGGIVVYLGVAWALCIVAGKADHEIEENDEHNFDDEC